MQDIFVMFFVGRLILRELRFKYNNKLYMLLIVKAFATTLRKVCTCQKLKFSFLLLEYCKIRECYAVANAFTIRSMYSLLLYLKRNSRKINRPTKNMTKMSCISKLLLTKMQVKFSGKRENWQFVDLSRLQFTSDESELIPDYI
jgi:hypothetical protein